MNTNNADHLNAPLLPTESVVFIGLMGVGKTTIGTALARHTHKTFIDSDQLLESRTGFSVATIFEVEGEAQFRDRESAILHELVQSQNIVLSTGGGAVLREENRRVLRTIGTVVYLHAPPEVSYQRIRRSRDRPLLNAGDPLAKLRSLYEERHALYLETAHIVIDSNRDDHSQVMHAVLEKLVAFSHDAAALSTKRA
jgi:shikimate kinase